MSNKAIRGVMSPAELSLGTEKWAELPFIYFHCYFRETTWIVNLGIFQILSPHILPFFFSKWAFQSSQSAQVPRELGSAQVPQAPQKVATPEEAVTAVTLPGPGWDNEALGLLGKAEPGTSMLLCGPASINLISSLQPLPTPSLPKETKEFSFSFPKLPFACYTKFCGHNPP